MKKQVKKYSTEEKARIAIEAITREMTIAQITSKYVVHANQIYKWKKEALEFMVSGPRGFNQGFVWTDRSVNSRKRMAQKKSNILGFGG